MAITLENVNTLVWRYLSESGFQHSAFIFQSESMVDSSDSVVSQIPSGMLISILQKSILYMKLEKIVKAAKHDPNHSLHDRISLIEKRFPDISQPPRETSPSPPTNAIRHGPVNIVISSQVAQILHGHQLCVFGCSWSPNGKLLATASADATAIIWEINTDVKPSINLQNNNYINPNINGYNNNFPAQTVDNFNNYNTTTGFRPGFPIATIRAILGKAPEPLTTDHGITTIDWNSSGTLFATGSFDKIVRIYRPDGSLYATLQGHRHNVFAVRFNPSGQYIVTCSADKTAILWNVATSQIVHQYDHHTDTILDVAWRDNYIFASASADNTIGICNVNGSDHFLRGHTCHVTAVSWSNDGVLLASASEDKTVRIWQENSETIILSGHKTGVSCVKWVPHSDYTVVSSSQDGAVFIWDARRGQPLHIIERHTKDVISLSVSPCGNYIASGGTDMMIDISSVSTGERVATIEGSSPIFEVQWDPTGRFLAICFDDSTVAIVQSALYLQ